MKCSKSLFNKSVNSIVVPKNWDYNRIDSIIEQVLDRFQDDKQNYLLRYDGSVDVDAYIESIDEFIETLISEFPIELSEYDKNRLVNQLRLKYYPPTSKISKESDNIPITAIIPETELKSQHDKSAEKLNTTLETFFGTSDLLKTECKNQFKKEIFNVSVIYRNGNKSRKVTGIDDLNQNIENYKNQLYNTIYTYLINRGINPEKQIPQMFVQKEGKNQHTIHPGYSKVLDDFYLLINSGDLQSQLEIEWLNKYTGKGDYSLLEAVNSYIQLLYFDELLKDSVDDYISINDDQDQIILEEDGVWHYKYSFGKTNQKGHKLFTEDIKDATKELGVFSKFLIQNIPIKGTNANMELIDFYTALLKLKDHLSNSTVSPELKNAMLDFHNNPEENFKFILENILTQEGKFRDNILKIFENDRISYKLNENDIRIIESLYDYLYKGNESIYSIENNQLKIEGFDTQYPILKTIIGAFDSVSQMDYMETVYDYDEGRYLTKIKSKYYNKKELFDTIDGINRRSREIGRKSLINIYSPYFDGKDLKFTVGEAVYTISPNGETAEDYGILDSKNANFKISIRNNGKIVVDSNHYLTTYFDYNLLTIAQRQRLIDRVNLSENEETFMDLLSFIDNVLGTTFSKSEQGLLKLNLFLNQFSSQETGFKKLLLGAAKVLTATKINVGFLESGKENFREYFREVYPFPVLKRTNLDKSVSKYYFYNTYRGEFLYGVSKSNDWVDNLINAELLLRGESTKAVTKNLSGSNIPNVSPAFLGREVQQIIADQRKEAQQGDPINNLLFTRKAESITGIVIDTDVKTQSGKVKQVSAFTTSELLYHNFINKFVIPMQQGKMIIQPTVYSDKKKFINYIVDINTLFNGVKNIKSTYELSSSDFEQLIIDTLGRAYNDLYQDTLDDYQKIFGTRDIKVIQSKLKNLSKEKFVKLASSKGVTVMEEIHYRKNINGKLSVNELLQWYSDLYNDPTQLKARLQQEKIKFFNSISRNRTFFKESDVLKEALDQLGNSKDWIANGLMIVAKDIDGNPIFSGKIPENAILNPLLENYFYSHVLVSNNLRLSIVGTELNHLVKSLPRITNDLNENFNEEQKVWIRKNSGLKQNEPISFVDVKIALDSDLNYDEDGAYYKSKLAPEIYDIYQREIYKVEAAAQNAQLKRTVPVPGTMRYFLQGSLDGIASTMKCAVVEDIKAPVYQFSGKQDKPIEAYDGAAFIDPFTSILENLSLQDSEVGTIKKTLWHDYKSRYLAAELVKYAEHTITNQVMRQSENSDVKMYDLFRKMTNEQWDENEIPDITRMASHKVDSKINFAQDILKGSKLFYKLGDQHIRITDFGKDNFGYYTIECATGSDGEVLSTSKQKIYHFFGDNGEHYKSTTGQKPENTHTINSLYELHASLGGIYSESIMEDGELHYSEASNYAVVNFMNNVCIKQTSDRNAVRNQKNYRQPLKTKLINYLINQSAIKNGAQNVNHVDRLKDDKPLYSFTMSTRRYGIQQDSDHEADEARMTEFSQVISSLDAGGHYHDYVKEIYNVLGRVAIQASNLELEAAKEYIVKATQAANPNLSEDEKKKLEAEAFNILYDVIGKALINNIRMKGDSQGLAYSIIQSLKKTFNLSTDHTLDKYIIPLSDSNIYSQILQIFSSIINKKSIKREYPGNGMVMTPGYGFIQLFDVDGIPLQFEDILKRVTVTQNPGESLSNANRRAVNAYLEEKQKEIPIKAGISEVESFYPSDNVNVHYQIGEAQYVYTIGLNDMKTYQEFINNTDSFIKKQLSDKGLYKGEKDFKYIGLQKNITKPRDLAPSRITFSYMKDGKQHDTNIFASYIYKDAYGEPTPEQRKEIQKLLNNIDQGFIYLSKEDEKNDIKTPIFNLKNIPAEKITSNIYQSKFGMSYYDSLQDITEESFKNSIKLSFSTLYDIALTKGNGRNLYISFDSTVEDKRLQSWKGLTKETKVEKGEIVKNVWVTEDNIPLFMVGRERIQKGYTFSNDKFYDEKGNQIKGNYSWDGKNVWKYIEFIENVKAPLENGKNFRYYNINRAKLDEAFIGNKVAKEAFMARIVKNIYDSDSYETIVPNTKVAKDKLGFLSNLFSNLHNITQEKPELSQLWSEISGLLYGISKSNPTDDLVSLRRKKIGDIYYPQRIGNYIESLAHKKYISFQKAQDFVTSRIPAQTLQSFMATRNVGFTGVHTNQSYQSPWETYLQGSDYDIDKSYMMGHEFDDNGMYLGWSNLFDYTNLDTLHASENLPYPRGYEYSRSESGVDINQYVQAINSSTNNIERINNIVKLLNFLNSQNNLEIFYEGDDSILEIINNHENTHIAPVNAVAVMKNFISSHIQKQIQGIKNMMAAYSPIEMSDIQDAAEDTPKAHTASELSVLNPAMLAVMQNQNMVGKNVVGIAANGQKANLIWNYYMNDVVRKTDENDPYLRYAMFNFESNRIANRFVSESKQNKELPEDQREKIQTVNINRLPDTNFSESADSIKELFNSGLSPKISTDLLGSQYISAATDNAKELILDKINAGSSTAKCHLFLVSLGFDVKDIVKFMTSDAVSFIESASQENIFSDYSSTLENITTGLIKTLRGQKNRNQELYDEFLSDKTPEQKSEILLDALEFQKVLQGANEFSNLGKGLGINQGVPTTKEDLAGWKKFFRSCIRSREEALGIVDKNGNLVENHELAAERVEFDFDKYFQDKAYREQLIAYYDKIKVACNIFAIFNYVPHFAAMFEMLGMVSTMDQASLKSRLNNKYMEQAERKLITISDGTANRINAGIDILLIQEYFKNRDFKFPLYDNYYIFNSIGARIKASESNLLLNNPNSLKSFHFIFNNYIIPELQNGTYFKNSITLRDGTVLTATEANNLLIRNKFIQGLVSGNDGNRPIYKLDIDMNNIDKSPISKIKFQEYLDGFIDLHNIMINGNSLSDWFMIYNLVVNKNNFGRDRLTTLFKEVIKDPEGGYILSDYLQFVGHQDRTKELLDPLFEENTLESILQSSAKVVTSYIGQNDMFVKTYDDAGDPHYWRNNKRGKTAYRMGDYYEVTSGIPEDNSESTFMKRQRIADNEEYGFGLLASNYLNSMIELLNTNWEQAIGEVIQKGYINIINKCE